MSHRSSAGQGTDQTPAAAQCNAGRTLSSTYLHTLLGQFDAKVLSHRAAPYVIAAIALTALIVPSVQFVVTIQKIDTSPFREKGERHRTALGRWLPTAGELTEGDDRDNPYDYGHWFPTPPLVLLSLVPLYKAGYVAGGIIWSVLKIGGLTLAVCLVLREMRRQGTPVPLGVQLMTMVFGIRPIISDIQHGNLNIFMMIWLALTWVFYLRGRDLWAGVFLALAIVTKVTPALALVYFAYKREWRVVGWAFVGLVAVFLLIPGALLGFDTNLLYLRTWFDMLVRPFAFQGYATIEIANQSLFGTLSRLLSNAGILSIKHMSTDEAMRAGMENMARPATALGRLLRPALSIVTVGLLAWWCRRRGTRRSDPARLLEFGLVLIAMLLLSERTWKHHLTTLPLIYLGIWYVLTCVPCSDRFRAWYVAGLSVQFVLLVVGDSAWGEYLGDHLLDAGLYCWGLLLCFFQTAILLRHTPSPEHVTRDEPRESR